MDRKAFIKSQYGDVPLKKYLYFLFRVLQALLEQSQKGEITYWCLERYWFKVSG